MRKIGTGLCLLLSVLLLAIGGSMAATRDTSEITGISAKQTVSGEAVSGAKLRILDSSGNTVKEWTTDSEAFVLDAELTAGETYILQEVEAPSGFLRAEDLAFTVNADGSRTSVTMKDIPTDVKIEKRDSETEEPLSGAILQVLDENDAVVDEWTSDGTVHELTGVLAAGKTYRLHEVDAPNGYEKSEDVEFTVPETEETKTIVFYNVKSTEPAAPKTGEMLPIAMIVGGLVLSLCGILLMVFRKKTEEGE